MGHFNSERSVPPHHPYILILQAKGAEGRSVKVEVVDGPSLYAVDSGVEYNQRLYSFIQLRMQVCRELNIPGKEESDLNVELASMHAMCLGKPSFLVCQDLVS